MISRMAMAESSKEEEQRSSIMPRDQLDHERSFADLVEDIFSHVLAPEELELELPRLTRFLTYETDWLKTNPSGNSIASLFDPNSIDTIVRGFSQAAGVTALVRDINGREVTTCGWNSEICQRLFLDHEEGRQACRSSNPRFGSMATDRYIVGPCHCGFMSEGASVIHLDNVPVATFVVGGVTTLPHRSSQTLKEMVRAAADAAGVDMEDAVTMFGRTRHMPPDDLDRVCQSGLKLCQFLSQQISINNEARNEARAVAIHEQAQQLLHVRGKQGWVERFHSTFFDPNKTTKPWNAPVTSVLFFHSFMMPVLAGMVVAGAKSDLWRPILDWFSLLVVPANTDLVKFYYTPFISWAFLLFFVIVPFMVTYPASRHGYDRISNIGRTILRLGSLCHIYVLLVPMYCSMGYYLFLPPVYTMIAANMTTALNIVLLVVLSVTFIAVGTAFNIVQSSAVASPPLWFSLYRSKWPSLSVGTMVTQLLSGAAVSLASIRLHVFQSDEKLTYLLYNALVGVLGCVVSTFLMINAIYSMPVSTAGSTVTVAAMASSIVACFDIAILSIARMPLAGEQSDTFAHIAVAFGATSALLVPLVTLGSIIRLRYCEQLVFSVILGENRVSTKPLDVLRTVIFHPRQRKAILRELASRKPEPIAKPDLGYLSAVTIELGTRPIREYDKTSNKHYSSNTAERASMARLATDLLSRTCETYSKDTTLPLKMAMIKLALDSPDTIDGGKKLWAEVKDNYFSEMTPTNRMVVVGMERFIEHMTFIHAFDGEDKASAYLSTQKMLADAREQHLRTLVRMSKLWPLLIATQLNISAFATLVKQAGDSAFRAGRLYRRLHRKYPRDELVREWYCLFLDSVMQDHTAAQRIRANSVGSDASTVAASSVPDSVSSVGSGFGPQSTSGRATAPISVMAISVVSSVLIIVLQLAIGGILQGITYLHEYEITTIAELHDASLAIQWGTIGATSCSMEDSSAYFPAGWDDTARTLTWASTLIEDSGSRLKAVESIFGRLDNLVVHGQDATPVRLKVSSSSLSTLTSAVKDAIDDVLSASGDATSSEASLKSLVYNGGRIALPVFKTVLTTISAYLRLSLAWTLLLFVLLIAIEVAALTTLSFWLSTRVFPSVIRSSSRVMGRCVNASEMQVRRKIRLTLIARERFKDINLAEDDDFVRHAGLIASATEQNGLGLDSADSGEESPDIVDDSPREHEAGADSDPTLLDSPTTRRVAFAAQDEIVLDSPPLDPGSSSSDKLSSDRLDMYDSAAESDSPAVSDISSLDAFIQAVGSDLGTDSIEYPDSPPVSAEKLKIMTQQRQRSRLCRIKLSVRRMSMFARSFDFHAVRLVLAVGLFVVFIISEIVLLGANVSFHYGPGGVWEERERYLAVETYPLVQDEGVMDFHIPRFIMGSVDSSRYFRQCILDSAMTSALEAYTTAPSIGGGDSMAALIENMMGRRMNHKVAVILAAYGYGLTAMDVPEFTWDYNAETNSASDTETYGRTLWYSDKASDLALNRTQQLAIAQAIIYDSKLTDELRSGTDAILTLADSVAAKLDPIVADSWQMDLVTYATMPAIQLALLVAVLIALNACVREHRVSSYVNVALLLAAAMIGAHLIVQIGHVVLVDVVFDANKVIKETTSTRYHLSHVIAGVMAELYATQRMLAVQSPASIADAYQAQNTAASAIAQFEELGLSDTPSLGLVGTAAAIHHAAGVAASLALSVIDPDDGSFRDVTWNIASGRTRDTGRFTNNTYDMTLSDTTKLDMAWNLVLSDGIVASDVSKILAFGAELHEVKQRSAERTIRLGKTVLGMTQLGSIFVFTTPILAASIAFILPGLVVSFTAHSSLNPSSKAATELSRQIRPLFQDCLTVLGVFALLGALPFALVIVGNVAIIIMDRNLASIALLDSTALSAAARAMIAQTGPSYHTAPVTEAMESLAESLPSLFANKYASPITWLAAREGNFSDVPRHFSRYLSDIQMFSSIAEGHDNVTYLAATSHARSVKHLLDLDQLLEAEFVRRSDSISSFVEWLQYVTAAGTTYMVVVSGVTFLWLFLRQLRRIRDFSRAFQLIWTHLS
ncbi:Sensory domain found in PocR [Carpediemonas membranifera]|uniref:Sensory domain found in PocR n=1 Tax=Carpediemonas membranifera TaxID=201153 RepID=A0A8J6E0H7_9EUKA|nr:Sensory domain found in PocR [Carpediemonas membranifera]|eukprot:KAG9392243.1 Sensory domain found in PocR [Carpediemonas membranifera]